MKDNFDLFDDLIEKDILLRDIFIEPPFSVLDSKKGEWRRRKREWISKGIQSEIGRDSKSYNCHDWIEKNRKKDNIKGFVGGGTSIFDPVLCELMYRWFCPDFGKILDPFAGGSVRGIVAEYLGYKYTGIDLSKVQIKENIRQAFGIFSGNCQLEWIVGDSNKVLDSELGIFDFIFSCPPYMDLEKYSDKSCDLSNMTDESFITNYESIIKKSCDKLKKDCYACFVVGEVRDKKGFYKDFVGITKRAFYKAGLKLYNDAILLNAIGTAALRVRKQFEAGKKLVKIHQNILIFKRG